MAPLRSGLYVEKDQTRVTIYMRERDDVERDVRETERLLEKITEIMSDPGRS
jgi:hypothetical protein